MRISDWSSDVCSSDLAGDPCRAARVRGPAARALGSAGAAAVLGLPAGGTRPPADRRARAAHPPAHQRAAAADPVVDAARERRSEEHTSELQSLMRISYAVFCLKKNKQTQPTLTQ